MATLIITIVVIGLLFWAIKFLPLDEPFLTIIKVLLILIAIIAVLNAFGILSIGRLSLK